MPTLTTPASHTTSARCAPMRFTWSATRAHRAGSEDDGGRESPGDERSKRSWREHPSTSHSVTFEVTRELPLGDGALVLPTLPVARPHVVVDEGLPEDRAARARSGQRSVASRKVRGSGARSPAARRVSVARAAAAPSGSRCPRGPRRASRHRDVRVDVGRRLPVLEARRLRAPRDGADGARAVLDAPARVERRPHAGDVALVAVDRGRESAVSSGMSATCPPR
jgi:hypothetical protein